MSLTSLGASSIVIFVPVLVDSVICGRAGPSSRASGRRWSISSTVPECVLHLEVVPALRVQRDALFAARGRRTRARVRDTVFSRRTFASMPSSGGRSTPLCRKPRTIRVVDVAVLECDERFVVELGHEVVAAVLAGHRAGDRRPSAAARSSASHGNCKRMRPSPIGIVDVFDEADRRRRSTAIMECLRRLGARAGS